MTGMGMVVVGMDIIIAQVPLERVLLFVSSVVTYTFLKKNLSSKKKKNQACCPVGHSEVLRAG